MTPEELENILYPITQQVISGIDENLQIDHTDFIIRRPNNREHGDWALNTAMMYAKRVKMAPRDLAEFFVNEYEKLNFFDAIDIAGPGFINLTLNAAAAAGVIETIEKEGDQFGVSKALSGQTINLEFVSANPTGPMHLGHTRWAALGDSLARILKAAGADLVSEFYINDAGNQMDNFGASVLAALQNEPTPEDGYSGPYIHDLAERVRQQLPQLDELDEEERFIQVRETAYHLQLAEIKASLQQFRVNFDVFFSERVLHEKNASTGLSKIDEAVTRLREQGHVFDEDRAVWVKTTDFGDDKDRVIQRSNGVYTYYAADAAYYLDKKDRGFAEKIYLLGADHHGYVQRLKALAGAAGDDPEKNITVLIGQLVNLNGAKLSKRAGNIIEINDLMDWLGTDALRFWLSRFPADSPIDLDGEQLKSQSNDNPVFYVQYAHARTQQVARNAKDSGIDTSVFDGGTLTHETEKVLLGVLSEFKRTVTFAATLREPHRVTRYLEELAAAYHRWYDACRVIPLSDAPIEPVHHSRLALNMAAAQVLRNGLNLIGVVAPERM